MPEGGKGSEDEVRRRVRPLGRADPEARLRRRSVFDGRIVRLSVDTVRFPDGSTGELELVRHPGACAVLPLLGDPGSDDPDVLLLRQYRYAGGGLIYEVPAGIPEAGEDVDACVARELEEETGYAASEFHYMTRIHTTPGFSDEVIHLYLATGLQGGTLDRDEDEFIEVERMSLSQALDLIRVGRLTDCKSIATILYAHAFLLDGPTPS